jgi:polyphosphate kinase
VFGEDETERVWISSADWMPRNLDRRVEAAVPIQNAVHRAEIRRALELMLDDNRQAWDMASDGRYTQRTPANGEPERATHKLLIERAK